MSTLRNAAYKKLYHKWIVPVRDRRSVESYFRALYGVNPGIRELRSLVILHDNGAATRLDATLTRCYDMPYTNMEAQWTIHTILALLPMNILVQSV